MTPILEVRGAVWVRDAETGRIKWDRPFYEFPDWYQMAVWNDVRLSVADRQDILKHYEAREAA